eukprot:GHRR01025250.1.p3 GENE.GHRR01025250.1~~GHRR01025250.1.p3  ORF type:complete len:100 (+),score=18.47 GHRR01025250.1:374-673(+)
MVYLHMHMPLRDALPLVIPCLFWRVGYMWTPLQGVSSQSYCLLSPAPPCWQSDASQHPLGLVGCLLCCCASAVWLGLVNTVNMLNLGCLHRTVLLSQFC